VAGLEHDLADLKRRLARQTADEQVVATGKRVKRGDDWLDELADQDADFFRRRLGMKGK